MDSGHFEIWKKALHDKPDRLCARNTNNDRKEQPDTSLNNGVVVPVAAFLVIYTISVCFEFREQETRDLARRNQWRKTIKT